MEQIITGFGDVKGAAQHQQPPIIARGQWTQVGEGEDAVCARKDGDGGWRAYGGRFERRAAEHGVGVVAVVPEGGQTVGRGGCGGKGGAGRQRGWRVELRCVQRERARVDRERRLRERGAVGQCLGRTGGVEGQCARSRERSVMGGGEAAAGQSKRRGSCERDCGRACQSTV